MTVVNSFLENIAKVLNNEAYTIPTKQLVGTEATLIPTDAVTLPGIIGADISLDSIRSDRTVTYRSVRSGAEVIDTEDGDNILSTGLFDNGNVLQIGVQLNELQTTAFDIEFDWEVRVRR
jgi:hypothetical protein